MVLVFLWSIIEFKFIITYYAYKLSHLKNEKLKTKENENTHDIPNPILYKFSLCLWPFFLLFFSSSFSFLISMPFFHSIFCLTWLNNHLKNYQFISSLIQNLVFLKWIYLELIFFFLFWLKNKRKFRESYSSSSGSKFQIWPKIFFHKKKTYNVKLLTLHFF